jgi:uncharacterized membrane protein
MGTSRSIPEVVSTSPDVADETEAAVPNAADAESGTGGTEGTDEAVDAVDQDSISLGPHERVIPSWTEPLARQATRFIGGPLGRHGLVGRQRFLTPLRVLLLIAIITLAFGWADKSPCLQQYQDGSGHAQLDWRNNRQYYAFCYTDAIPLYSAERLDQPGMFPYKTSWLDNPGTAYAQTRYMEYPVLIGVFQWVNAKITQGWMNFFHPNMAPVVVYFDVGALFLALAWLVVVWATSRTGRKRPWDTVILAISPLVIVHVFTNFDALAAAFAATGLLAWARRKPWLAGVLLGLGTAAKLYPGFLLLPLLVLCLRAGKMDAWLRALGGAVVAWLVVNLPIMVLYPHGWWEFYRNNTQRGAEMDSIYSVISGLTGWKGFDPYVPQGSSPTTLNNVSLALFLLLCAGIVAIALTAQRRPRVGALCYLVIAAFLLTNKVWSPQYSLWLVPLAVLALPRWKLLLAWMTVDALVWFPLMAYFLEGAQLGGQPPQLDRGLPAVWFQSTVIVRDLLILLVCAFIIRDIYRPAADLLRMTGDDDPHGGVLDGAPDRFVLGRARRALASASS